LNTCPFDYAQVIGAWSRLHSEEFPEQNPMGFDLHERLAEVHEDRNMDDVVGIKV
jgi:hypothetical protein